MFRRLFLTSLDALQDALKDFLTVFLLAGPSLLLRSCPPSCSSKGFVFSLLSYILVVYSPLLYLVLSFVNYIPLNEHHIAVTQWVYSGLDVHSNVCRNNQRALKSPKVPSDLMHTRNAG